MIRRVEIADPVSYTCNACSRGVATVEYAFGPKHHLTIINLCEDCEAKLKEEISEGAK